MVRDVMERNNGPPSLRKSSPLDSWMLASVLDLSISSGLISGANAHSLRGLEALPTHFFTKFSNCYADKNYEMTEQSHWLANNSTVWGSFYQLIYETQLNLAYNKYTANMKAKFHKWLKGRYRRTGRGWNKEQTVSVFRVWGTTHGIWPEPRRMGKLLIHR